MNANFLSHPSAAPRIWIEEVWVCRAFTSPSDVIRKVPLSPGLNIIHAKQRLSSVDEEINLAGHSAGKTTFCRFLRYLLGEERFANQSTQAAIQRHLPSGGLLAKVHVDGKAFVVRRAFRDKGVNYVFESSDISVELPYGLLQLSHEQYLDKLGLSNWCDSLVGRTIPKNTRALSWGQLLAWCSRDQEARFQNLHDWRSPRSQSKSPEFDFRTEGPLYAIRAFLGLIDAEEDALSEALNQTESIKRRIEDQLRDLSRVHSAINNRPADELRLTLSSWGIDVADAPTQASDLFEDSIDRLAEDHRTKLQAVVNRVEAELDALQVTLQKTDSRIEELVRKLGLYAADREEKKKLLDDYNSKNTQFELTETEAEIFNRFDETCRFGEVLFGRCDHIRKRLDRPTDSAIDQPSEADVASTNARLKVRTEQIEKLYAEIAAEKGGRFLVLAELKEKRSELQAANERIWRLNLLLDQSARSSQGSTLENEEREAIEMDLERANQRIQDLQGKLSRVGQSLAQRRQHLSDAFEYAIRGVKLSKAFTGAVSLEGGLIGFGVNHGDDLSGEAVRTLGVLLADLACGLYSLGNSESLHPGLVIHDSPREADLDLSLYLNLLRFIADVSQQTSGIQYIVTTTTPPTEELGRHVKLLLDSSEDEGYLLKLDLTREADRIESSLPSL